jgi:hypothetical protein
MYHSTYPKVTVQRSAIAINAKPENVSNTHAVNKPPIHRK